MKVQFGIFGVSERPNCQTTITKSLLIGMTYTYTVLRQITNLALLKVHMEDSTKEDLPGQPFLMTLDP